MSAEPRIVERAAQPYVAAKGHVTMQTVGATKWETDLLFRLAD